MIGTRLFASALLMNACLGCPYSRKLSPERRLQNRPISNQIIFESENLRDPFSYYS
jgi:hypothetical protein